MLVTATSSTFHGDAKYGRAPSAVSLTPTSERREVRDRARAGALSRNISRLTCAPSYLERIAPLTSHISHLTSNVKINVNATSHAQNQTGGRRHSGSSPDSERGVQEEGGGRGMSAGDEAGNCRAKHERASG